MKAAELAPWLKAQTTYPEDLGLVPSTDMSAHNQLQGIDLLDFLVTIITNYIL